jgi:hypothetical protein
MGEIFRDDEGVVLKKLGKPVRRTVVDKNTRVSDDDISMEVPSEPSERPSSSRKRTLLANAGPDENGKIDFEVNPDCLDYLLQYHESYGHSNDAEGVKATAEKVMSGFNKTFKSQMTAQDLIPALESKLVVTPISSEELKNRKPGQRLRSPQPEKNSAESEPIQRDAPKEKQEQVSEVPYLPLKAKSLAVAEGQKVLLSGEKLEICKILGCKNICVVTRNKGKINQNGLMHAACAASKDNRIDTGSCPQEAPLSEKEEMAFQMFLAQFGDELKAKKMLYISKKVFSPK